MKKKQTNSLKNCNKIVDLGNGIYINYDVYISDFDVTQKIKFSITKIIVLTMYNSCYN